MRPCDQESCNRCVGFCGSHSEATSIWARPGIRSVLRDVEAQFFVVTRNQALRQALRHEYEELARHSVEARGVTGALVEENHLHYDFHEPFAIAWADARSKKQVTLEDFRAAERRPGIGARMAATLSRSWM